MLKLYAETTDVQIEKLQQGGAERRYIRGLNGKLWRLPELPFHYKELSESLSAALYGLPDLTVQEQQVRDVVYEFLQRQEECLQEDIELGNTKDGYELFDVGWLAYRIAEAVVAQRVDQFDLVDGAGI